MLTTAVLRCLKLQVPQTEIHFCTKAGYVDLVTANPYVSKVHLLGESMPALLAELKQEKFDLIIDLHHNLRSARIKMGLAGVPVRSFKKLNWQKWLLTRFKINRMPSVHIVDRYLETVSHLGVSYDGQGLDYYFPKNSSLPAEVATRLNQQPFIAMVCGGTYHTKKLPAEKIRELFSQTTIPMVLLGDAHDAKSVSEAISPENPHVINLCGLLNLAQSARVISMAGAVISHDTGLMHIAAALKKPVVSVWGNTVPEFGMYPLLPKHMQDKSFMAEVEGLSCRPCSKLGYDTCPKGHFACMMKQDTARILAEAQRLAGML